MCIDPLCIVLDVLGVSCIIVDPHFLLTCFGMREKGMYSYISERVYQTLVYGYEFSIDSTPSVLSFNFGSNSFKLSLIKRKEKET